MSDDTEEIGDIEDDDTHDPDDAEVDWSQVDRVQEQVDAINDLDDEDERTEAAKRWATELGESSG